MSFCTWGFCGGRRQQTRTCGDSVGTLTGRSQPSGRQHHDYQPWIDNDRRLHELLTRLEALGAAAFEADPRWER